MSYIIVVVGAGGTGSYFLKEFARFISTTDTVGKVAVTVIDGDRIEEKNLQRQSFYEDGIDHFKAEEIVELISESFGISNFAALNKYVLKKEDIISAFSEMKESMGNDIVVPVIIGCVDNHRARQVMEEVFQQTDNCVYFDSANDYSDGEVVFSYKNNDIVISPVRSKWFPEVGEYTGPSVVEMSCTELNAITPQHIATNMNAANILLSGMTMLMIKQKMIPGVVFFDTFRFTEEFRPYISGQLEIVEDIRRRVG